MLKFMKKVVYIGTLVGPLYNFFKDICVNGYAIYINHQQEIETAKMRANFNKDELEEISVEEFEEAVRNIRNKNKKKGK